MEGKVRKWITSYGFITGEEGGDYFIHLSEVKGGVPLKEGQKVKFDVKEDPKGQKAVNVELVE
jgi:CspA family cold shock protein